MRISDWSSDVCSSDLQVHVGKLAVVIAALDADAVIEQRRTRRRRQLVEAGVVVAENDPVRLELPVVAQAHFPVRAPGRRQLLARDDATQQFAIDRVIVEHEAAVDAARAQFVVDRQILRQRSDEHTSELQSLMRISYAVFCLKKT